MFSHTKFFSATDLSCELYSGSSFFWSCPTFTLEQFESLKDELPKEIAS